jgi:hypothetical protein
MEPIERNTKDAEMIDVWRMLVKMKTSLHDTDLVTETNHGSKCAVCGQGNTELFPVRAAWALPDDIEYIGESPRINFLYNPNRIVCNHMNICRACYESETKYKRRSRIAGSLVALILAVILFFVSITVIAKIIFCIIFAAAVGVLANEFRRPKPHSEKERIPFDNLAKKVILRNIEKANPNPVNEELRMWEGLVVTTVYRYKN